MIKMVSIVGIKKIHPIVMSKGCIVRRLGLGVKFSEKGMITDHGRCGMWREIGVR